MEGFMELRCKNWLVFLLWLLLIAAAFSASSASLFLSDKFSPSSEAAAAASMGRNLLQAKKPCPIYFEFKSYTIITSQCKGPTYPPLQCCATFKDFACPYAKELNALSNYCASTMFSYINLYGKYPPGLFATVCRDIKVGLKCPQSPPGHHQHRLYRTFVSSAARIMSCCIPIITNNISSAAYANS